MTARPKKQAVKPITARVPVTLTLLRDLLEQIDELARREDRTRSRTVEIALRQYVQANQRRSAA